MAKCKWIHLVSRFENFNNCIVLCDKRLKRYRRVHTSFRYWSEHRKEGTRKRWCDRAVIYMELVLNEQLYMSLGL